MIVSFIAVTFPFLMEIVFLYIFAHAGENHYAMHSLRAYWL